MLGTFALPILGLIYTEPHSSIRLLLVPLVALGTVCYHKTARNFMPNGAIASAFDGPFMLLYLTAVDAFLLQRLRLSKKSGGQPEFVSGLKENGNRDDLRDTLGVSPFVALGRAAHTIFSYRAIGTSREVKNVPKFSAQEPGHVPSRPEFLLKRGLATAGAFLLVDYLNHQAQPPQELFAASKSWLFVPRSDVTAETIIVRVFSTVLFWFMLRVTIGLIYNATSLIGVATFLTEPGDWPPYFGSPKETFTLRKFWAAFWHSGLRNPLVGTANFVTDDVLCLPKGTIVTRYVRIFNTFVLSGTIHALVDNTAGVAPSENLAMTLFIMQAVGITLEDFVEWIYRTYTLGRPPQAKDEKVDGKGGVETSTAWQRAVGYLWVAAWLIWTTPAWSYQNIRLDAGQLFPFSFFSSPSEP